MNDNSKESVKTTTILTITEIENIENFFQLLNKLSPHTELIVIKENRTREDILRILKSNCSYSIETVSEMSKLPDQIKSMSGEAAKKRNTNQDDINNKKKNELHIELSGREREVLYELLMGHKNREIARILKITEKTVKNHLFNVYKKYDVVSRTQLFHKLLSRCPCIDILEKLKTGKKKIKTEQDGEKPVLTT
ncbi:MAG: LuxR C-terminal-related transcriptional regulator [Candidatus Krumholzibacteriota bacterium]|nr:LuxR C-terminal-related transcriptional regulator [Candidatus Krumholzibacteriota bacterium]